MANVNELMALGIPAALAKKIAARFVAKNEASTIASGTTFTVAGTLDVTGNAKIGSAAGDTVGFYGATAVTQPASASQAAVTATTTTVATTTALETDLDAVRVLANQLRSELVTLGLIKGAA